MKTTISAKLFKILRKICVKQEVKKEKRAQ